MAIIQTICDSFKQDLAQGVHNFTANTGDQFAIALYTSLATLDATTTFYTTVNEVVGNNYVAGGYVWNAADNITPQVANGIAFWSFATNPNWPLSTITARGALIYNKTKGNKAVCVIDFGADKTSFNGLFTLLLPVNAAASAVLRIE